MKYLSPSRINCYFKCPRLFYYKYVLEIPTEPSIHLYKGSLVHSIIENVFKNNKWVDIKKHASQALKKEWKPSNDRVILTELEDKQHYKDTEAILKSFGTMFQAKIDIVLQDERIRDKNHAWNTLKPRLSEHELSNDELKLKGIIDSIETDFDGRTFIIDYKTSKKYQNMISEEYVRQLSIYALLYAENNKKLPDYVGINYLRYGEVYMFPVTQTMIDQTKQLVQNIQNKITSTNIDDYPLIGDKYAVEECKQIQKRLDINLTL